MGTAGKLFLALCLITIGGGIVDAQSVPQIEAQIPFAFVVGDTRLPAGKYLIRTVDGNATYVLQIRSAHDPTSVVFDTVGGQIEGERIQRKTRLVFDVVEGQYFLAQIWVAGSSMGNELVESRMEKRLAGGGSQVERQAVIAAVKRPKP